MTIAFIGGGNMASAIIAGLLRQGQAAAGIHIVEPYAPQRDKLLQDFAGVQVHAAAGPTLAGCELVVWAVKPQVLKEVAQSTAAHLPPALHLSVVAGIGSDSLAAWLGHERVVRAMPNTPALVGQGMTALYARAAVQAADRSAIEHTLAATGELLWVAQEADLDAVTAVSGSGPAYVFYFMEAMMAAGEAMGLSAAQARQLTLATFRGATQLAQDSPDSPATLRERVTSKGGTTYAAISHLQAAGVAKNLQAAMRQAQQRAQELGQEFGH